MNTRKEYQRMLDSLPYKSHATNMSVMDKIQFNAKIAQTPLWKVLNPGNDDYGERLVKTCKELESGAKRIKDLVKAAQQSSTDQLLYGTNFTDPTSGRAIDPLTIYRNE